MGESDVFEEGGNAEPPYMGRVGCEGEKGGEGREGRVVRGGREEMGCNLWMLRRQTVSGRLTMREGKTHLRKISEEVG